MLLRIRTLASIAVLCCLAATAQAGAVFGSAASSTTTSPITLRSGADADMNGAPDATAAEFRNNQIGSGAQTFTVAWDVTGAEANIDWRLFVYNRTNSNVSITGMTLTDINSDLAVSTNSMVLNTGPVASGTVTQFDLTQFQSQSDYSVAGSFDWANVEGLLIQFTLLNPVASGSRTSIRIDAVSNPEPGTLALFGLGILGLGAAVRRRRRGVQERTRA